MPIYTSVRWYVGELAGGDPAPQTRKAARLDLLQFIRWWEGAHVRPFDPALLDAADLPAWRAARERDGAAPATINRALSTLRGYGAWLVRRGTLPADPLAGVRPLPTSPLERPDLPPESLAALFGAAGARGHPALRARDAALVALLGLVGLRTQEVCNLRVGDLDLAAGLVAVRGRCPAPSRSVPLPAAAAPHLGRYLAAVRESGGVPDTGDPSAERPLLVGLAADAPDRPLRAGLDQRSVQRVVRRLGRIAAGHRRASGGPAQHPALIEALLTVTPEQLRRHAARRLLDEGRSLTEVQQHLGHRRLTTTRRYLRGPADRAGGR